LSLFVVAASKPVRPEQTPSNLDFWSGIVCDIAEISDQNRENEGAVQLLLRAIRSLPEKDQDAVLGLLLQGLAGNDDLEAAVRRRDERRRITVAALGGIELRSGGLTMHERLSQEPDAKVVPIRFPPKLYDELKGWCEQHHFPMAAVVRGLVERFLQSQELP
jgi:hypothetical protein